MPDYAVFIDPNNRQVSGNTCQIIRCDTEQQFTIKRTQQSNLQSVSCYRWPESGFNRVNVRCFNGTQLIQCCGHGLMAAAADIGSFAGLAECELQMNGSRIKASIKKIHHTLFSIKLMFQPLSVANAMPARWLELFIPLQSIVNVVEAGGEHGYLVVELDSEQSVKDLLPPSKRIQQYTQKALIVCSRSTVDTHSKNSSKNAIVYRYFAPQYGVVEDSATGSAMRVLTCYWQKEFNSLTARQLSPQGGLLTSEVVGNSVVIHGFVERLSSF